VDRSSSTPSAPTSFTPLYAGGLCEAVIITPGIPSRSQWACSAGVGTTPSRSTSTPTEARPLAAASASIRPVLRVSLASATRSLSTIGPTARTIPSTDDGVTSSLATPRTPLDPKTLIPVSVGHRP
jgi:hypothetical protein